MLFSLKEIKKSRIYYIAFVLLNYWIALVISVGIFMSAEKIIVNLEEIIFENDYHRIKQRCFSKNEKWKEYSFEPASAPKY